MHTPEEIKLADRFRDRVAVSRRITADIFIDDQVYITCGELAHAAFLAGLDAGKRLAQGKR